MATVFHRGGRAGIRLEGELDVSGADGLTALVLQLEAVTDGDLVIDLAGLSFIDAIGLQALVTAWKRLAGDERRLLLENPGPSLTRVLRHSGLVDPADD